MSNFQDKQFKSAEVYFLDTLKSWIPAFAAPFMRFLALGTLDLMDSRVCGSYVLSGRRWLKVVL